MYRIKNFLFKNSNTRQIIVKNTFWYALGTTVTKMARAIIIIYVAKLLGAGEYGIFTYALSVVGIFMIFADIGITNILTRELSKDGDEGDKAAYLSTAFLIKIGFLLFTILLAIFVGPLISKFPEADSLIVVIAIFVALESFRSFLYSITRAKGKMQVEAGLGILAEAISIVIILILFIRDQSVVSLAQAFVMGNLIGLMITIIFLRKNLVGVFRNFKGTLVASIIQSSWPFAVMGIFGIFLTNIDSVMIGFWNNPTVLGLYAAAQKPISLLYVLPGFLSISLFPFFSRMLAETKENASAFITKSVRASLSLALPIVLGGIILAGPLLSVTFGDEYKGAVLTFQILLLTLIPAFPGAVFSDVIVSENGQKIFIKSTAFGAITNVILNFILIPKYGIVGSAVATLAAQFVMNGILYYKIRKSYGVRIFSGAFKILLASVGMSAVVYLLVSKSVAIIAILPIAAIVYAALLYLMKEELVVDIKKSLSIQ